MAQVCRQIGKLCLTHASHGLTRGSVALCSAPVIVSKNTRQFFQYWQYQLLWQSVEISTGRSMSLLFRYYSSSTEPYMNSITRFLVRASTINIQKSHLMMHQSLAWCRMAAGSQTDESCRMASGPGTQGSGPDCRSTTNGTGQSCTPGSQYLCIITKIHRSTLWMNLESGICTFL